jgi:hypothetical protein
MILARRTAQVKKKGKEQQKPNYEKQTKAKSREKRTKEFTTGPELCSNDR